MLGETQLLRLFNYEPAGFSACPQCSLACLCIAIQYLLVAVCSSVLLITSLCCAWERFDNSNNVPGLAGGQDIAAVCCCTGQAGIPLWTWFKGTVTCGWVHSTGEECEKSFPWRRRRGRRWFIGWSRDSSESHGEAVVRQAVLLHPMEVHGGPCNCYSRSPLFLARLEAKWGVHYTIKPFNLAQNTQGWK